MLDLLEIGTNLAERGLIPDDITRAAIRHLCATRARLARDAPAWRESEEFLDSLRTQPVALFPDKANEQHYELPAEFFELVLGHRRKYSCCYLSTPATTLDEAEDEALARTCENAEVEDGQHILELGCGWGSLTLWLAERYPNCRILAVSNSHSQRQYIENQALQRRLSNLRVVTVEINDFQPQDRFDRVISVEMFEHLRNYELILQRISTWLKPQGKVLIHHFCHKAVAYPFDVEGAANWMGRYFFTGGMMPTDDMLARFSRDLTITRRWTWNGLHYRRTADLWLMSLDKNRTPAMDILTQVYGHDAHRWFQRWRMFFLAVSELFGYDQGTEWFVTHLLLEPTRERQPAAFVNAPNP